MPAWNPYAAACPTRFVLDRTADKWVVLVLGLLNKGPMRFNQLRREIEGLSQKMLSQTRVSRCSTSGWSSATSRRPR